MRKLVGILVVVALAATPALADFSKLSAANQWSGQKLGGSTGVYAPGDPTGAIYLSYKIIAAQSDVVRVTFGIDWPYVTSVYSIQTQFGWAYDNSEVQVLRQGGAGPYAGPGGGINSGSVAHKTPAGNFIFGSATWQGGVAVTTGGATLNPSAGTIDMANLLGTSFPSFINPSVTYSTSFATPSGAGQFPNMLKVEGAVFTGVGYDFHAYPLFYVDLHVKDVIADSFLDAIMASAAFLFYTAPSATGLYWTAGAISAPAYGIGIIPEPASLSLLGVGMAAIGMGAWRRRRR